MIGPGVANRVLRIVERLLDRTAKGTIEWTGTEDAFSGGAVFSLSADSFSFTLGGDDERPNAGITFRVIDSNGEVIANLSSSDSELPTPLRIEIDHLWQAIRRAAEDRQVRLLDKALKDLEGIPPF